MEPKWVSLLLEMVPHIEGTRGQLSCCGRWGWAMQFLLFVREKQRSGSCRRCRHKKELGMGWVGDSH